MKLLFFLALIGSGFATGTGGTRDMKPTARPTARFDCTNCSTNTAPRDLTGTKPLEDPVITSTSLPDCTFPTVERPQNVKLREFKFCTALAMLKRNSTLSPRIPNMCICIKELRDIILGVCGQKLLYFLNQYYVLERIRILSRGNVVERLIAARLQHEMEKSGVKLSDFDLINTRFEMCGCIDKIKSRIRELQLDRNTLASLLACEIDGGRVGGTQINPLTLQQLVSGSNVANRILQFCPQRGCCSARLTLTRTIVIQDTTSTTGGNRSLTTTRSYGGTAVDLIDSICQRYINAFTQGAAKCSTRYGFMVDTTRSGSGFSASDRLCVAARLAAYATAKAEYGQKIQFSEAMCNQDDLNDRTCVDKLVTKATTGDYTVVGNLRRVVISTLNRVKSYDAKNGTRTRLEIANASDVVGEASADGAGSDIEVQTTDPSGQGRFDYTLVKAAARLLSRLKKMIIKQRCDVDGATIEADNATATANGGRGEVEVDGVFTAQRGSTLKRVLMRLRNAAVLKDTVDLRLDSKIVCEGSVLLDGTTLSEDTVPPATMGMATYGMDCSGSSTLVAGRGKTNVIRVRTKSVRVEVGTNGTLRLESRSRVNTLVTTSDSRTAVSRNATVEVEDVEGDGDLEVDSNSEIRIVRSAKMKRLILKARAILRIANFADSPPNRTLNLTEPDVTTLETDVDVTDDSTLAIERRAVSVTKNMTLRALSKIRVKIDYGDNLGKINAIIDVAGKLIAMFPANAPDTVIEIDIDARTFCDKLGGRILLARWKSGSPMFPTTVRVIIRGVAACLSVPRRRLMAQSCNTVVVNGQVTVDCVSTNTPTHAPYTPGTPSAAPTPTTTTAATPTIQPPGNNSAASFSFASLVLCAIAAISFV